MAPWRRDSFKPSGGGPTAVGFLALRVLFTLWFLIALSGVRAQTQFGCAQNIPNAQVLEVNAETPITVDIFSVDGACTETRLATLEPGFVLQIRDVEGRVLLARTPASGAGGGRLVDGFQIRQGGGGRAWTVSRALLDATSAPPQPEPTTVTTTQPPTSPQAQSPPAETTPPAPTTTEPSQGSRTNPTPSATGNPPTNVIIQAPTTTSGTSSTPVSAPSSNNIVLFAAIGGGGLLLFGIGVGLLVYVVRRRKKERYKSFASESTNIWATSGREGSAAGGADGVRRKKSTRSNYQPDIQHENPRLTEAGVGATPFYSTSHAADNGHFEYDWTSQESISTSHGFGSPLSVSNFNSALSTSPPIRPAMGSSYNARKEPPLPESITDNWQPTQAPMHRPNDVYHQQAYDADPYNGGVEPWQQQQQQGGAPLHRAPSNGGGRSRDQGGVKRSPSTKSTGSSSGGHHRAASGGGGAKLTRTPSGRSHGKLREGPQQQQQSYGMYDDNGRGGGGGEGYSQQQQPSQAAPPQLPRTANPNPVPIPGVAYRIVHAYKAARPDEVDVQKGDIVVVSRVLPDTGWCIVENDRTGRKGAMPLASIYGPQ
ncbi:hypothetical protein HK102_013384 [Quaeritorhiza haematococci]|nr:hypothetical protein HK102_013384 [Quaeritorhiza haematococci]